MRGPAHFALIGVFAALATSAQAQPPCRTVHGRMSVWNGAPAVRIAVTGAHHVLGVAHRAGDPEETPDLPASLLKKLTSAGLGAAVAGDFIVCPVVKARPGRIELVRVVGADRLSIRRER
ncbi:MAG: hypothetical protein JSR98_07855 [Proteobacteria bacterium]|nr:hypothetical protein [Pseudomonadota bacterium]